MEIVNLRSGIKVPIKTILTLISFWLLFSAKTQARLVQNHGPLDYGFTPIKLVSPTNIDRLILEIPKRAEVIKHFCSSLGQYFAKYNWDLKPCGSVSWKADLRSNNGHPLIYAEFGEGKETTLLLGGVHPDELTPVPMAFRFAQHLTDNPDLYNKKQGIKVIVAPLANPDGFLRNVPTRANANGVDLNRNFFTMDWYAKAKKIWKVHRKRSPRHFPGYFPNSEVETVFQMRLIDKFRPDKILSIHAPLGFLDYDGPGDRKPRFLSKTEKRAKHLVHSISEKSKDYRVVDYSFYPGSLGNYAGNERKIPTVTLELETTDPTKVKTYWQQFLPGILQSIHYPFSNPPSDGSGNASQFSTGYERPTKKTI